MKYDGVIITTVAADSVAEAEKFLIDFADGLADTEQAAFTAVLYTNDTDNYGQRVIYLHSLDEESECDRPLRASPDQ